MKPVKALATLLAFLACSLPSAAQSYQTSFGEVRFDRGRSPSTWHGVTEVETASGALGIAIPLGPGIGARGLKWVPTLRGRWAPLVSGKSQYTVSNNNFLYSSYLQTTSNGGMGLDPGHLRFVLTNYQEDNTDAGGSLSAVDYQDGYTYFAAPDGYSGSFQAVINPDLPNLTGYVNPLAMTGSPVHAVNPAAVAGDFGFDPGSWDIAKEIDTSGSPWTGQNDQFVRIG